MNIFTDGNLAELVVDLLGGRTVVFPTETSYGLGCDATNQKAVDRIFAIKGRRADKPLLVVVPTIEMAKCYLVWNDLLEKIAVKYWPGPVTVVGEYQIPNSQFPIPNLAHGIVSTQNTVAVRVTAHPLLKSITEKMNRPLVATSANIADQGDMYDAAEIIKAFHGRHIQPDIILDYGVLPPRAPTTIVRVIHESVHIIRQGEVMIAL